MSAYKAAHGLREDEDFIPVGLRLCRVLFAWPGGGLIRRVAHDNYHASPAWAACAGRALHDLPLRPEDYARVVAVLLERADLRDAVLSAWDLAASADDLGGDSTPRRAQRDAVLALLRAEVPDRPVLRLDPAGCTCCPCSIPDRGGCRVHDAGSFPSAAWSEADERRVYPHGRSGPCGLHPA